jgi:nucleotide-binding universal stress UspA family protein
VRKVNELEFEVVMLVLGVRTRSKVGKPLLGSTAESLLLAVSCSVLSVKGGGKTRRRWRGGGRAVAA